MLSKIKWIGGFVLVAGLFFTACQSDSSTESANEREQQTDAQMKSANDQKIKQMDGRSAQQAARGQQANQRGNAKNKTNIPAGPKTTISFAEMSHDFGTISDGDKVRHKFEFTNSGEEPLIISNAKGSCGCTVPNWPKDPIPPGEKGIIEVEYNSRGKGKEGGKKDSKTVTVTANTQPPQTRLKISANVVK